MPMCRGSQVSSGKKRSALVGNQYNTGQIACLSAASVLQGRSPELPSTAGGSGKIFCQKGPFHKSHQNDAYVGCERNLERILPTVVPIAKYHSAVSCQTVTFFSDYWQLSPQSQPNKNKPKHWMIWDFSTFFQILTKKAP